MMADGMATHEEHIRYTLRYVGLRVLLERAIIKIRNVISVEFMTEFTVKLH